METCLYPAICSIISCHAYSLQRTSERANDEAFTRSRGKLEDNSDINIYTASSNSLTVRDVMGTSDMRRESGEQA